MKKKREKFVLKSEIIAQMPKVELHCHLDGSLSLSVIKELAKNAGIHMTMSDEEILEKAQAPENTKNLLEYLQRFDFVLPLLQTYKNLELAAYDVVRQAANDNIKYIEIRFAPSQHLLENLTLEEAVEAAAKLPSSTRKQILATESKTPVLTEVTTRVYKRSPYVVAEVLLRAKGKCQSCKRDAPFLKEDGTPFLEVHHIEWLSKGGEDSVENAIALCPNCHRQAHYGALELVAVNKQG